MENENVITILNDLIRINHDRVVGYEKAHEELKAGEADLGSLFQRYEFRENLPCMDGFESYGNGS